MTLKALKKLIKKKFDTLSKEIADGKIYQELENIVINFKKEVERLKGYTTGSELRKIIETKFKDSFKTEEND